MYPTNRTTGFESSFIKQQLQELAEAPTALTTQQEIVPGVYFVESFGSAGIILTSEGIVVIDTGNPLNPEAVLGPLRALTDQPVRTIIYTHGHADHAANAQSLLDDAVLRGYPRPRILAHRDVPTRMERYQRLHTLNDRINRAQFGLSDTHPGFPADYQFIRPDEVYDTAVTFQLGELTFELRHAKGETDDATWIFIPERQVLFSGDLFVSSCPNAGNPFKVQRFVAEWAEALEEMSNVGAVVVAPGHGPLLRGSEVIVDAFRSTVQALRYLDDAVVERLNAGQSVEQIRQEVRLPHNLANHWAMAPIYGCPDFIVVDLLRRYGGWYDGNPTHLFPGRTQAVAQEIVRLVAQEKLLRRAEMLMLDDPHLALHLLDFIIDANPAEDTTILQQALACKYAVLTQLAEDETSIIQGNILRQAGYALKARIPRPGGNDEHK